MYYAIEAVQVWNRGLSDERLVFTGHHELYDTRDDALIAQGEVMARTGLSAKELPVYPVDPSEID